MVIHPYGPGEAMKNFALFVTTVKDLHIVLFIEELQSGLLLLSHLLRFIVRRLLLNKDRVIKRATSNVRFNHGLLMV